jgi:hypothetical protein
VTWPNAAYQATAHRKRLSAPRFQRLVDETQAAFELFKQLQQPHPNWSNLDRVMSVWRRCVTGNRHLLSRRNEAGCAARTYERMGWLERVALLDAHLEREVSPWSWMLRAAAIQYCVAHDWPPANWPPPRWPLNGAKPNAHGETLLHEAVRCGLLWATEQLIEWGAVRDVVDDDWSTPLHHAARFGMHETVAVLLSKGARPDPKDGAGRTPLDVALRNYDLRSSLVLIHSGGTTSLLPERGVWLREVGRELDDAVVLAMVERASIGAAMPSAAPAPRRARM